jgi:hypothetical protein
MTKESHGPIHLCVTFIASVQASLDEKGEGGRSAIGRGRAVLLQVLVGSSRLSASNAGVSPDAAHRKEEATLAGKYMSMTQRSAFE